jgi:enediyne biosynthesis protein E3
MRGLLYLLGKIDPREVQVIRRGFVCTKPEIRERLEYIASVFLEGYHLALKTRDLRKLSEQLMRVEGEYQGFAYEGAAMALTLLDGISSPRKQRWSSFAAGAGKRHLYMLHVGAGWGYARLPWLRRLIESSIRTFHPVLRWLVLDGYGFHEGYFHWRVTNQSKIVPSHLSENARHVFYQGLGRGLWFVKGADSPEIARTIAAWEPQYRSDAWSGVGLACAYAGGMCPPEVEELRWEAGVYSAALAQGAAFAAKARQLAGNYAGHTETACAVLCGMSADTAAALCDETLQQLSDRHPCPYQQWRSLLQEKFLPSVEMIHSRCVT